MKRFCRYIKKIVWMKWRLLTSKKGGTRRPGRLHSLKKHQRAIIQINLKKHQGHQSLLMIKARKDRALKRYQGQAMDKRPLQKQAKKLKRPQRLKKHQSHPNQMSLKKHQSHQNFFIQAAMIQAPMMNRSLKKGQAIEKKLKRPHGLKTHQSHLSPSNQARKK